MSNNENSVYSMLPTGKPHISFSEVKLWKECSFRHHLTHIKKISIFKPSPILEFGTAVHAACEHYLLNRVLDENIAHKALDEAWERNKELEEFTDAANKQAHLDATAILTELPMFLDTQFPGWTVVDAEHQLYESIEGHPHAFKGFIDGVIKASGKRGEDLYWIIDWKTSIAGWHRAKRSDDMIKAQLALYKNYWCQKNPDVPIKNVRCGFVILKKSAKPNNHCELFTVPMGDVPIKRSLKVVSNMIASVKRGMIIKNRDACKWCEFKDTPHCT